MSSVASPSHVNVAYAFNSDTQAILASRLRVADTHLSRLIGLIGVRTCDFHPGGALWIVPCHGVHTFAMRFPIDVVYLDSEHRVRHIEENVRPWRITPIITDAATVLELPARTAWQTGTKIGDHIELHIPSLQEAA
ncbi:MAG TPA: DUF192 domain-containing protein [Terriglobales bacterium]|nr:DUF192 domain-containing protein [Terriglobales bacterium]